MNKSFALAAACAAALFATSAGAATYVTWSPVAPDGSLTATYGNTGIAAGEFDDTFDFALPDGTTSFTISSTFTGNADNNIDFSKVAFNGTNFVIGSTGQNEYRFLNNVTVANGATQRLEVSGASGGNGSYSGVISFTPGAIGAVPEPAAWAMMIAGFGGVGAVMRRRRLLPVAA